MGKDHGKRRYRKSRVGDSIYHTGAWRRLRRYYYTLRHGICERCGKPGDIVHHKIPITEDNIHLPEITLSETNLELLCHSCHNNEHKVTEQSVRNDVTFDDAGNLIQNITGNEMEDK